MGPNTIVTLKGRSTALLYGIGQQDCFLLETTSESQSGNPPTSFARTRFHSSLQRYHIVQ
ncbi:hypothetical protein Lser_V15G00573 [Lactuca serriola]